MTKGKFHFIGIGGIGMSAIARALLARGCRVTGSDLTEGRQVQGLRQLGARCYVGHRSDQVGQAEAVVYSSAVPDDNPELREARRRGIPVLHRAGVLACLMRERLGIAVAGTHGKTTTSCLVAWVLHDNGLDPAAVLGGELAGLDSNVIAGGGFHLVAEADESDGSLLELSPQIAVVTSLDADVNLNARPFRKCGFDTAGVLETVESMFAEFVDRLPEDGCLVVCHDHLRARRLKGRCRRFSYGLAPGADLRGVKVELEGFGSHCLVTLAGEPLGAMKLPLPGRHNLQNALAALGVALECGLSFERAAASLARFPGVRRRFEVVGQAKGVTFVDDYAHNPQKVKAALNGARAATRGRVVAVFQPHRYSRTRLLLRDFACAFEAADTVLVTDIYSAGEKPMLGISAPRLIEEIRRPARVLYTPGLPEICEALRAVCRPGDLVVAMGAGSVTSWVRRLPELLCSPAVLSA